MKKQIDKNDRMQKFRAIRYKKGWVNYSTLLPPSIVDEIKELVDSSKINNPSIWLKK